MRRLMLTSKSATVPGMRLAFLGGLGFGSVLAYMAAFFSDGRLGRRRRALAGAKARHLARLGARRLGSGQRGALNLSHDGILLYIPFGAYGDNAPGWMVAVDTRGPAIACRRAHSMSATLPAERPSFSRTIASTGTSWMRVMDWPA